MSRPIAPKTEQNLAPRVDPPRRGVGGVSALWQVLNHDPARKYVWVFSGTKQSLTEYRLAGFRFETYDFSLDKDGKPILDEEGLPISSGVHSPACLPDPKDNGQRIEVMDHYLMSCSRERADEIEDIGINGDGGRKWADKVENMMIQDGGYDPIRGKGIRSTKDLRHGTLNRL